MLYQDYSFSNPQANNKYNLQTQDLAKEEQISVTHLSEAFFYRNLDKKYWN